MALGTFATAAAVALLALAGVGATTLLMTDHAADCSISSSPPAQGGSCSGPAKPEACPDTMNAPATGEPRDGLILIDLSNPGGQSQTRVCIVNAAGAKVHDATYSLERDEHKIIQVPVLVDVYDVHAIVQDNRTHPQVMGLDLTACEEPVAAMDLQVDRRMLGMLDVRLDNIRCDERPATPSDEEPDRATFLGTLLPKEPISRDAVRTTAIAMGAAGIAAGAFAVLGQSNRFYWLFFGLFTRVTRGKALEHPVRARAQALVLADPGIGPEEIRRELALGPAQVSHHMRALVRTGIVIAISIGRNIHFFPPGRLSPNEMRQQAVLRAPAARRLYEALHRHGHADVSALAAQIGWSVPYASRLAARLRRAGLIEGQRVGRRLVLRPIEPREPMQALSA